MNANPDNITFTIKDTKLYVPVAIKSYQNFFVEDLKDQFTDSIKTKIENKNMRNECRHFLKSNLVEVKRLFVLIYLNRSNHVKRFNIWKNNLPKMIIDNYNATIVGKFFMKIQLIQISNGTKKLEY